MCFSEKTVTTDRIFTGQVVSLRVDTVELPDKSRSTREIVSHPGGVGIVPLDDDGGVYMVRQYRKPFDDVIMEIPAGKLGLGEEHYTCGIRELKEETGLSADKVTYLGYAIPSPGFTDEKIHIYLAEGLTQGDMQLDEGEFLDVEKIPLDTLLSMIDRGELIDAKTVIGLLKTKRILDGRLEV